MTALRLGIVGCGDVVRRFHAGAFAAQPGIELVGWVNRTRGPAEALAMRYGGRVFDSVDELIAEGEPDGLVIATAEWAHLEPLAAALGAGLHAFVEKPLHARDGQAAVTEADFVSARDVLASWDRSASVVGVNFNYRTLPHVLRLKRDLEDGVLGAIEAVGVWSHLACWSHTLDLVRWTIGEPEALDARRHGTETLACSVSFAGGYVGTLIRTGGPLLRPSLLRIDVHGERGRATVDGVDGTYSREPGEPDDGLTLVTSPRPDVLGSDYERSHERSIADFCAALREERPPPVTGDDGLAELRIEAAIDRSARTGRPVALAEL